MLMSILYVVFFMYVWFDTDAFVDYSRLLGMAKTFLIKDWDEWRLEKPRTRYLDFLVSRRPSFLVRLVCCRHCLCFWLSAVACHFGIGLLWTPAVYLASYAGYNIYTWIIWRLRKS